MKILYMQIELIVTIYDEFMSWQYAKWETYEPLRNVCLASQFELSSLCNECIKIHGNNMDGICTVFIKSQRKMLNFWGKYQLLRVKWLAWQRG